MPLTGLIPAKKAIQMKEKKDSARELKLAIALLEGLLILALAAAMATNFVPFEYGIAAEALLVAVYFWLLWASRKKFAEKKEYLAFFAILMVLVQLACIPQQLGFLETGFKTILLAGTVFLVIIFVMLFRLFFSRNWVWARVVSCSKGKAIVETEYDFFNGIGNSIAEVACIRKLAKGERVKVRLRQAFMGKKPASVE